jgi:hypothetical protein
MKELKDTFESKAEIVKCLVDEWGYKESQFYNNSTNKSVDKFWTYNRCLQYLFKLRREYVRTEHGKMHKEFYNEVYLKD